MIIDSVIRCRISAALRYNIDYLWIPATSTSLKTSFAGMTIFRPLLRSGLCERRWDKLLGVFFLCVLSDDLLLDVGGYYFVMAEGHRVTAASAGNAL